ncbi:50S ribosomal protein L23 [Candidatus Saccharibacteria bacterium]|nr:MAG: 50S ribosomal protein L23 [Candidatus Saccharibacteria bacterium]
MKSTTIIPLVSEKSYAQSQNNVYVFRVPLELNKNEIAAEVEKQFEVTVTKVKTLVQNGKAVRYSRGKNRYPGTTTRKDTKKAYVTLKDGDKLDVFDAMEQTEENK